MSYIGIDVGYSKNDRSCGVAVLADGHQLEAIFPHRNPYISRYPAGNGHFVEAVTLRMDEVVAQGAELGQLLGQSVMVVDGMIAPGGPPRIERPVDQRTMAGDFQNRAVPASVRGGGEKLVDATYEIVEAILGHAVNAFLAFTPAAAQQPGPRVLETNPTIGLATSVAMVEDIGDIPSRATSSVAKSDYYWERGGGMRVATVLGSPHVAQETHHERCAGLFALAVAVQIGGAAADGSAPVFMGNPASGIYVLLGPIHPTWTAAVQNVGIIH